jgi:hypothetical protein
VTRVALTAGENPAAALHAAAAAGEDVVAIMAAGQSPFATAIARAAVEAVAVERAPAVRVNAVAAGVAAAPAAIEAAVAYLERARSVTGQWLAVG